MARPRRTAAPSTVAVAYVRVSTVDQAEHGAGLDAQRSAVRAAAEARGLTLLAIHEDTGSGARTDRPGLAAAMSDLTERRAGVLLVAKQDRLTRSLFHLADLLDRSAREGWALVALDTGTDTGTPNGRMVAGITGVIAEWERHRIGERTREALAERRAAGVRLGRPLTVTDDARRRVVELRAAGLSWRALADALDAEGWPTGQGGRWHPTTARRLWLAEQVPAA